MNDCGVFAVKKLDRSREGCDRVFERELEILGSVKHINLVNLRGYCRLPLAKLLIYDYMAMGSLDEILHGMIHKFQYSVIIFQLYPIFGINLNLQRVYNNVILCWLLPIITTKCL